jgi:hypothetical protein
LDVVANINFGASLEFDPSEILPFTLVFAPLCGRQCIPWIILAI